MVVSNYYTLYKHDMKTRYYGCKERIEIPDYIDLITFMHVFSYGFGNPRKGASVFGHD